MLRGPAAATPTRDEGRPPSCSTTRLLLRLATAMPTADATPSLCCSQSALENMPTAKRSLLRELTMRDDTCAILICAKWVTRGARPCAAAASRASSDCEHPASTNSRTLQLVLVGRLNMGLSSGPGAISVGHRRA